MSCRSGLVSAVAVMVCMLSAACEIRAEESQGPLHRGSCARPVSDLAEGFVDPPTSSRPAVYWVWVNGLTDRQRLTYELEQMKEKGIRGVYVFDVGARDSEGIVPHGPAFMGPESLKAIGHTIREATRLGLEVGLVTSSSWNCGGPWVRPELASMGLYRSQITVDGPRQFSEVLPFPAVPEKAPKRDDGLPVYYKDVAVLAMPQLKRLPGDSAAGAPVTFIDDVNSILDSRQTSIDLTDCLDANGRLVWDVPARAWTIMRFVCTNTGEGLKMPSPKSQGFVIDHLNPKATRMHFDYLIGRLREELGGFEDTALKQMYVCSYEVKGSTWTPDFLQEFKERRGYDMIRYLPVIFGSVVRDAEITERFRYDFRKTLGELLVDAFYKTAREVSNEHGLLLCAEAGGPGPPLHQVPVDALKALGVLDVPRGEFWKEHDVWVVKETACASHIYGKRVVDMESFTSWRHWQDGPFDLKPLADRAMCGGTNHFTFHTCAHNPQGAGLPGWVYHAGTHISPSIAWWPKAKPFIDYLSRCCYLLQQGLFVADVCYYYGDQGFNFVPPRHVDPSLGYGYDYDVTNAEVILTRMAAKDGKIVLPDGVSYELLVLPGREDIDLEVLKKIEELVRAGATVVGRKPTRSNGMTDYPRRGEKVRNLANELWGLCDGKKCREQKYGQGKIIWGRTLRDILDEKGVGPDFRFDSASPNETHLDYIHRRTESADIYFVSNKDMCWVEVGCIFRVSGKSPEAWIPETGQMRKQIVYDSVEGGTRVPLRLPPAGSAFIVFRAKPTRNNVASVRKDETEILPVSLCIPQEFPSIKIEPREENGLELFVWENGGYTLRTSHGEEVKVQVKDVPATQQITGPWQVRFAQGRGAPEFKTFPKLISWSEDSDDGVKYFSGIATYRKQFELSEDQLNGDGRLFLDLGRVRFVADVYLNGKNLGILWKPPFRIDISDFVRPGKNELVVEVANTWSNRLVGDAHLPKNKRYCRTNIGKSLTWRVPWKETPLLESGLLGPVCLISARKIVVDFP